jgi:hypothetical protein
MPEDFQLTPAAVANASLMLTTQLMRFLRTHGKITDKEVAAIYEATFAIYENPILAFAPPAPLNWKEQIRYVLNSAMADVLR